LDLDKKLPPDIRTVLAAAAILDITEYEMFQLAWIRWHGQSSQAEELEPYFVRYMFDEEVPTWVRHFARDVEADWNAGRLDKEALGIPKLKGSEKMVHKGVRYAVLLVVVLVSLIVLAQFAAQLMAVAERCVFPPCY
jgi:hypothetical protein